MKKMTSDWLEILGEEFDKPYFKELEEKVDSLYETKTVYPAKENIFRAFELTPFSQVKVVILGQDPYHGQGQAHGLSFSVEKDVPIPPSLMNMYKELSDDLGCFIPDNGNLEKWAKQGVLLLNTVLTVEEGAANSHKNMGWETFTDQVIRCLDTKEEPLVFLLWGNPAREKKKLLKNKNHLILEAPHPSPLSSYRGFFGCKHFSKTNDFLQEKGLTPIDWQIVSCTD